MAADFVFASVFTDSLVARFSDVAVAWLLTYLVHSTLILAAAWLVTSWKPLSESGREIVWKCALVGGLVTATLQMAVARTPLGGQLSIAPRAGAPAVHSLRPSVAERRPGQRSMVVVRRDGVRWTTGIVTFWLAGAGAALLWLTLGYARTLRALGDRMSLEGTPVGDRMRMLLARAGVRERIELTCSAKIASPVALCGNEVCLPRRALVELESGEQDTMLAHEIAHVIRRDPQWLVAARVIELVLFMQPLNRLARYRMQEIAEYLCDDWAVARTSRPVVLAKCLAAVAAWVGRSPRLEPVAAMVERDGSPLVRRVGRILRGVPETRSPRLALAASVTALAALAGAAPRVSVANAAPPMKAAGVVRALIERDVVARDVVREGPVSVARGTMTAEGRQRHRIMVMRDELTRAQYDSLLAVLPAGGNRAVLGQANVIVRRVLVDSTARDSFDRVVVWTRSLPSSGATAAGARRMQ